MYFPPLKALKGSWHVHNGTVSLLHHAISSFLCCLFCSSHRDHDARIRTGDWNKSSFFNEPQDEDTAYRSLDFPPVAAGRSDSKH
jgi:hypothetical protein